MPHRKNLIEKLELYNPADELEAGYKIRMLDFVKSEEDCFQRSLIRGHFAGSCWLESYDGSKFLLTLHKKMNLWLPLGGHADGESDIIKVAMKEAREESGLENIEMVSEEIFDIGIYHFPEYGEVPQHEHYVIAFLLRASDENEKIKISEESLDLKWFSGIPGSIKNRNADFERMLKKWKFFRSTHHMHLNSA